LSIVTFTTPIRYVQAVSRIRANPTYLLPRIKKLQLDFCSRERNPIELEVSVFCNFPVLH
jgi:hypothetical protein